MAAMSGLPAGACNGVATSAIGRPPVAGKRRAGTRRSGVERSSVSVGGAGGKLRDHLLQLVLIAGLVGGEEGGDALLEGVAVGLLLHLLELGDISVDRGHLLGLLVRGQL